MIEYIIIVRNNEGDVVSVFRPVDPLNPEIDVVEVHKIGDVHAEAVPVSSASDFYDFAKTCACGQWPLAEYGARCPSCTPANVNARPSQFAVGDRIAHVDSPSETLVVKAIDYRDGVPYLTLKGSDGYGGRETVTDVVDTLDLVRAEVAS